MRPPLFCLFVFQESRIQDAFLPWNGSGLPKPRERLVHVCLEDVDIRERRNIVCRKEVLIACAPIESKRQCPRQQGGEGLDHECQAIALVRAQFPGGPQRQQQIVAAYSRWW